MKEQDTTHRRGFLGLLLSGAAAFGITSAAAPLQLSAAAIKQEKDPLPAEKLFKSMKGKHRIVFDVTAFHSGAALAWGETFMNTNNETGTPDTGLNVVIILRSMAIGMALNDAMWEKYKLGEIYKIDDPTAKTPSVRNLFTNVKIEELMEPSMSIDVLQKRGVLVGVCSKAIQGNSEHIAEKLNLKADDVHKDLLMNIIPDVHLMPSGIWAVGRAQEHGCAYSFAG